MNNYANEQMLREKIENKLSQEIEKLKNTFIENQNNLLNRIEELKADSSNSSQQNTETLKELGKLKEELEHMRKNEELRRKYLYDVMLDKTLKYNEIERATKFPFYTHEEKAQEFNSKDSDYNENYNYNYSQNDFKDHDTTGHLKNFEDELFSDDKNSKKLDKYTIDNKSEYYKNMINPKRMNVTNLSSLYGNTNYKMNTTTQFIDMQTKEVYRVSIC